MPIRFYPGPLAKNSVLLFLGSWFLFGCAKEQDPPEPTQIPTDYREAIIGVYSGRAYYRHAYFGITTDSVNWASDADVSLDASDDSSIVISNLDTVRMNVDLTFFGWVDAPDPLGNSYFSSGTFVVGIDTLELEFDCIRLIDGVLNEYVFSGMNI